MAATQQRESEQVPVRVRGPVTGLTLPWRLEAGRERHTVVAKATLDLVAGALRDEPDPPCGDLPGGETLISSLRYPGDLAPVKPRCEVLVHGSVHGGGRKQVRARFRFGAIERALIAFGPRRYGHGGVPGEPRPFDAVPLAWEHAFGGAEQENPVGCGLGDVVPQLEDPAQPIRRRGDRPAPMGWWAVPPLWPQRWSLLGTYDRRWLEERYPYFPEDMDLRFFQHAPPAQQLAALRGDEPFALEGLHADHPALSGRLPGLRARCAAVRGERFEEVSLRLDTVVFDSDALVAQLIWRGALAASDRRASDVRELYLTLEPLGQPLTPAAFEQRYLAERALEIGLVQQEEVAVLGLGGDAADATPPDAAAEALRARIHERLRAAGLTVGTLPEIAVEAPPAPPPVSEALATRRRAEVEAALERGDPLDGRDLEGVDLTGIVLDGRSLAGSDLRRARLSGCSLRSADLRGAQLEGADLRGADLTEALLDAADLQQAQLEGAVLERASLAGASLDGACGDELRATGLHAPGLRAQHASLVRAQLRGADLSDADLSDADLSDADLRGAELRDVRLYRARATRVCLAEARLADLRAEEADLSGACLDDARLDGAVLDGANLDGARLQRAILDEAGLRRVRGTGAQLAGSSLRRARLAEAALTDASLAGADLMEATLEGARLLRADLRGASLYRAELFETDLRSAQLEGADLAGTRLEGT